MASEILTNSKNVFCVAIYYICARKEDLFRDLCKVSSNFKALSVITILSTLIQQIHSKFHVHKYLCYSQESKHKQAKSQNNASDICFNLTLEIIQ